jgi:hypothetical protein
MFRLGTPDMERIEKGFFAPDGAELEALKTELAVN